MKKFTEVREGLKKSESVQPEVISVLEKAYDSNDVKKVQQLEKKLQGMLKEVEKTMKGSGLSAPAFNNVRSGISKGLQSIQKFYKVANKVESVQEGLKKSGKGTIDVDFIGDGKLTKKLERKFKVKIKHTGQYTADISGDYKNIIKLLKSDAYLMDDDEIEDTFSELVDEGVYTKNDGGAFDGLRIAKYLSDEDGNPRWSRLPYGTSSDYIDQGMDMLKKDPRKAKAILAKPTPRSGSL